MVDANLLEGAAAPRRLGPTDLVVGPVAYGCWRLVAPDAAEAGRRIGAALDAGLTLVDTADVYGLDFGGDGFGAAESQLGAVLAAHPTWRDRMVLATKGGIRPGVPYDASAAHLVAACEASLRRLGVEAIDLYQVHRPDLTAHPAETAAALAALHADGKIRAVGVSNHTPSQLDALRAHLDLPVATHQPELSAWRPDPLDDGTLDQCLALGVTPLAWSPLGGGRLATGGPDPGDDADRLGRIVAVLDDLARREDADRSTIALAWVLAHPSRPVPIVGSQRPERIVLAARAVDVRLDRTDWYRVLTATGRPLP